MVLQDNPPPSDGIDRSHPIPPTAPKRNDPLYISEKAQNFDMGGLPRPFPLAPLMGYTERFMRFRIHNNWIQAEGLVGRPLTSTEESRLAYYIMEVEQKASYGATVGAAMGAWRAYKGMERGTYPFYVPKLGTVNPNKFLLIRGEFASYARHSWRFFVYGFIGSQLGRALMSTFAIPISQQHTKTDPELSEFVQDLEEARRTKTQRLQHEWQQRQKQLPTKWAPGKEEIRPNPPAGQESQNDQNTFSTGFDTDAQSQPPAPQQKKQSSTSSWSPWARQTPSDDDASPTGGMFEEEVEKPSTQGQSSWERLRRGEKPASPAQRPSQQSQYPRQEKTEGSTIGDSWTFAESEEERQRARERAQREFDERIERERRGEDFNDERKRW